MHEFFNCQMRMIQTICLATSTTNYLTTGNSNVGMVGKTTYVVHFPRDNERVVFGAKINTPFLWKIHKKTT